MNFSNAHDVRMPVRSRAAASAPMGRRRASIGYAIVVDGVRPSSVLLKEGVT